MSAVKFVFVGWKINVSVLGKVYLPSRLSAGMTPTFCVPVKAGCGNDSLTPTFCVPVKAEFGNDHLTPTFCVPVKTECGNDHYMLHVPIRAECGNDGNDGNDPYLLCPSQD